VLTDTVANVQTALWTTINGGANADVGNGVIVVAAETDKDAKVWYDASSATGDEIELMTLTGVSLTDLANFTADNFVIA
jgi:hypothetical protein